MSNRTPKSSTAGVDRRQVLALAGAGVVASAVSGKANADQAPGLTWISSTKDACWRPMSGGEVGAVTPNPLAISATVRVEAPAQQIEGFGGAFSEIGWEALGALADGPRGEVLDALFRPERGTELTLCRTPIGGNDIARSWYSYDEVKDDFALEHFSIDRDRSGLIPYIKAAQARRPDLKLWASPWSPPTWMKRNGHYAMAPAWPGQPSNGIRPDQLGKPGQDYFIQEDRYFDAYARYFRLYIEAYRQQGVPISTVMPQNEFNSAQPFPSCCWTPEGLARFLPALGREMGQVGVDIFLGTLERPDAALVSKVLADPAAGPLIKGVGVQWAGKGALADIRREHPALRIWGSEQECGIGTNDWRYARYAWSLMKLYFLNGASAWTYWNMVMPTGGMSGWGWPQNSLVTVDPKAGAYRLNYEFHLLRHLSAFVQPGAHRVPTDSFLGYENLLAFQNPDGAVVIVMQNDLSEPMPVKLKVGSRQLNAILPADSFNTFKLMT